MDRRDRNFPGRKYDNVRRTLEIVFTNEDGEESTHDLPAKMEVCPTCEGMGKHVNPNIDRNGITQQEFNDDPEFAESYMAGVYDVTCVECNGQRVVPVVDETRLNNEQKAVFEAWQDSENERYECEREDAHTRYMESGGYDC